MDEWYIQPINDSNTLFQGIFPANYVQTLDYHIVSAGLVKYLHIMIYYFFLRSHSEEDYPVPQIDSIALEAKENLYEWKEKLFISYAVRNTNHIFIISFAYLDWLSSEVHSNSQLYGRCITMEI